MKVLSIRLNLDRKYFKKNKGENMAQAFPTSTNLTKNLKTVHHLIFFFFFLTTRTNKKEHDKSRFLTSNNMCLL